jgi:hypothetical protein
MVRSFLAVLCGALLLACGQSSRSSVESAGQGGSSTAGSSGVSGNEAEGGEGALAGTGGDARGGAESSGGGAGEAFGSGGMAAGQGGADAGSTAAGAAGSSAAGGGPAVVTDAEICAEGCTLGTPLPSALCEDWRFPDVDAVPDFCVDIELEGTECAERCEQALGQVSHACNAALHEAVPCAARSNFYREGVLDTCYLSECYPELFRLSAECYGLREALIGARARWDAFNPRDYRFTYEEPSEVATFSVDNGVSTVVSSQGAATPLTIRMLFDRIAVALDDGYPAVARYDEQFGYPTEVEFPSSECFGPVPGLSFRVTDFTRF